MIVIELGLANVSGAERLGGCGFMDGPGFHGGRLGFLFFGNSQDNPPAVGVSGGEQNRGHEELVYLVGELLEMLTDVSIPGRNIMVSISFDGSYFCRV